SLSPKSCRWALLGATRSEKPRYKVGKWSDPPQWERPCPDRHGPQNYCPGTNAVERSLWLRVPFYLLFPWLPTVPSICCACPYACAYPSSYLVWSTNLKSS